MSAATDRASGAAASPGMTSRVIEVRPCVCGGLVHANPKSPSVRHQLRQELEKAIAQFEPRLRNVTVRVEDQGTDLRNLRFKINALLFLDPGTEPVTFDTFFDVNRCEYSIPK